LKKKFTREIEVDRRNIFQNASLSIRDIYDAIVELVTNSDDRYQVLGICGRIEIELDRRRDAPGVLRVRDFADGMSSDVMEKKISRMGGRVSGLESGEAVRGTNSRGAKDVAALGLVRFESIASDGLMHKCEITTQFKFSLWEPVKPTRKVRKDIGIKSGTGTLVTIELDKKTRIPRHDTLRRNISRLIPLREILSDPENEVVLIDAKKKKESYLKAPHIDGVVRLKQSYEIPGYPGSKAKLIIKRAKKKFGKEQSKFRQGGILIQSRHAVHEATLFDNALENEPNAMWFFGKLRCEYIDDLWNQYDDRYAASEEQDVINPCPVIDPSRKQGLTRDHPFVQKLFEQALLRLRPMVEEERKREENRKTEIESEDTRKRLEALEKAATSFMNKFAEEEEPSRDPDARKADSQFMEKGFSLNPPFASMVVNQSQKFWFNVNQKAFPEIGVGDHAVVQCSSGDIRVISPQPVMESHPKLDKAVRVVIEAKAQNPAPAVGLDVSLGPISASSVIEILESEAEKYKDIDRFAFKQKTYRIRTDVGKKTLTITAPIDTAPNNAGIDLEFSGDAFKVRGQHVLRHQPELGISSCRFSVVCDGTEARETVTARIGAQETSARLISFQPLGAGLEIRLEDIDLNEFRYQWKQNVLEIAAGHPSIKRYLGDASQNYPGQDAKHFRLLIAEIVAEAVCSRIVGRNAETSPETYEKAGWDFLYTEYCRYMTEFLPITHKLQCPEG
jgi:hypothetical protein